MAKDNPGFPDPNLNLGVTASFEVGVVLVEGEVLTGGAMVILLPNVNAGKGAVVFGCSGEVEEDGMMDGVGGSEDVL